MPDSAWRISVPNKKEIETVRQEDAYLKTEDLAAGYDGTAWIREISIHASRGEIVTLIGPNGAGKSTILKSIAGQLKPVGGVVSLDGREMGQWPETEIAHRMAVMMTERTQPELMTCFDVAAMGRYPHTGRFGILSETDREIVRDALAMVHAQDLADRDFSRISDGQRQRILLARAICQQPQIILLDEPTSFLDIRHKMELLTILKKLVREKRVAVLMSMHELDLAQKVSDYIVCVGENKIWKCGTPEEILTAENMEMLFGIPAESYQAEYGSVELPPVSGEPEVFVIGGNGSGIPVYRKLQRQGIPFAAGVLHENDLDYPVAKALAVQVVSEQPYEEIREETYEEALRAVKRCGKAICCVQKFGSGNRKNKELVQWAEQNGILVSPANA